METGSAVKHVIEQNSHAKYIAMQWNEIHMNQEIYILYKIWLLSISELLFFVDAESEL